MMGVDDKAIYADAQEMIHRISDDGPSFQLQKRLVVDQSGAKP
jgi:hypothetical protein